MADYFTNVSLAIRMSEEQFQWIKTLHGACVDRIDGEPLPTIPTEIAAAYEALAEHESAGIEELEMIDVNGSLDAWIHGSQIDCEYLASLVQQFMIRFDIAEPIAFQWSDDCSRPRIDAFGGGAFVITKTALRGMTTGGWIAETIAAIQETA